MRTSTFVFVGFLIASKVYGLKDEFIRQNTDEVESFDVSEKWPECKDVFEDIQVQGNCSSSWAIAVATSIRDRRCIKKGIKDAISAYDLISCCSDCQFDGKNGCNGGDHASAFHYFINQGIVSENCKPYPISPDPKTDAPKSTECVKKCDSSYKKSYENDKIRGFESITFSNQNKRVMEEIMKNGPVVAEFRLYTDFYNYTGGIYVQTQGYRHGYYHAKILGWGTNDKGQSFWRATASFGKKWGENGTFRILRSSDVCGFESSIIGAIVEETPQITTTPQPPRLDCQKITAYYNGTFHDPNYPGQRKFNMEVQITADVNLSDRFIYFKFDNFSKKYTSGYSFRMGSASELTECKTNQKEVCSIPLDKLAPIDDSPGFWVDFMPFRGLGYQPYLISILPFKTQRFTLLNTVGNCGTQLKDNYLYDSDPSLYKSCFCCGDKYNPDPSLNCPVSPWS